MKEHVELFHIASNTVYMLRALTELTTVVRTLAKDIVQIKADSIIINRDVMSLLKEEIIEEINENVNSKFDIVNKRVDKLFQQLGKLEMSRDVRKQEEKKTLPNV